MGIEQYRISMSNENNVFSIEMETWNWVVLPSWGFLETPPPKSTTSPHPPPWSDICWSWSWWAWFRRQLHPYWARWETEHRQIAGQSLPGFIILNAIPVCPSSIAHWPLIRRAFPPFCCYPSVGTKTPSVEPMRPLGSGQIETTRFLQCVSLGADLNLEQPALRCRLLETRNYV